MKKIFSILLCISMLMCSATGCGTDNNSSIDSKTEQSQSSEYETIKPPEDGWTIEELMSVTYVCGKQLTYPLTMNSFGNKVEIFEDTLKVQNAKETPSVMAELCSDNEFMGAAFFNRGSVDDVSGDTPINTISFDTHSDFFEKNGSPIILNGVSFGDTKEELIDKGE